MPKKIAKINFNDYKPLREVIFNSLREAIIVGELKPGERLMEVKLANKMGVSRTPVREAIRKLELEGLVIMIPRKGAHVADLSRKDIMNVLEVRASLDGLATALAAKRITPEEINELKNIQKQFIAYIEKGNLNGLIKKDVEFHEVIYRASRNEKLMQITQNLREQVQRFRVIYMKDYVRPKELVKEHNEIRNAIENKDEEKAREMAMVHIQKQEAAIINALDLNNL
jgi:DNA-binding GntR family transcriptional regulator